MSSGVARGRASLSGMTGAPRRGLATWLTLAAVAMSLPDAYIANADTQGHKLPH